MTNNSIFDEEYVDCNHCESYWLNQCDGTDKQRNCTAYKAIKRMDIPKQIDDLKKQINNQYKVLILYGIAMILTIVRSFL